MATGGGALLAATPTGTGGDQYTTSTKAAVMIQPAAFYAGAGPPLPRTAITDLRRRGFAVVDGWLPPAEVAAAREAMQQLEYRKTLQSKATRSDRVVWVAEGVESTPPGLATAVVALKSIAARLPLEWHPLEVPSRVMASVYETAAATVHGTNSIDTVGGYVAHRDHAPPEDDDVYWCWKSDREQSERRFTAIVYLNDPGDAWENGDNGGQLRVFLGADATDCVGLTASEVVDVTPKAGRLVLFDAKTTLHAVLPVTSPGVSRYALSCWILSPTA